MKLKNDKRLRDKLFTPESYQHPAKGHLGLWQAIIEKYTLPGETILDPMAGVGASLTAALMGRNVIVNEMEHHFLLPMTRSWAKMRQHPMLGCGLGSVRIFWGDARNLETCQPWPYQELAVRFPKAPDLAALKSIRRKFRLPLADQFTNGSPILASEVQGNNGKWTSRTYHFAQVRLQVVVDADNDGTTHPSGADSGPTDAIITSPPYEAIQLQANPDKSYGDTWRDAGMPKQDLARLAQQPKGYTRPSAIITSPPYSKDVEPHRASGMSVEWNGKQFGGPNSTVRAKGYTRKPIAAIANADIEREISNLCFDGVRGHPIDIARAETLMKAYPALYERISNRERQRAQDEMNPVKWGHTRPVDAVVSSPPWEQSLASAGKTAAPHDTTGFHNADYDAKVPYEMRGALMINAGVYEHWKATTNIGNLRGQAYWDSMRQVYQECHRVLRPGGIMALGLKGFTRDGKYVDLPAQTADLVESLGFIRFDEWQRELWSLSFWRILQGTDKEETVIAHSRGLFDMDMQEVKAMKRVNNGKLDERLRFESVLAFRKPLTPLPMEMPL